MQCLVILNNFVAAASSRSIPPKFAVPLTNQTLSPGDPLTLESTVTGMSALKKIVENCDRRSGYESHTASAPNY